MNNVGENPPLVVEAMSGRMISRGEKKRKISCRFEKKKIKKSPGSGQNVSYFTGFLGLLSPPPQI